VVKLALAEAYDEASGARAYPKSLYIRGGNIYNKDLSKNVISSADLEKYLDRNDYKEFYEGRETMLRAAVKNQPDCTGADCSGGVVGIWRKCGLSKTDMDATADGLCGNSYSSAIAKDDLMPGDFVGRSGHIGLYVGGGYVVEWVGGSYGCQLTKFSNRVAYDFIRKENRKLSAWTKYRRPKALKDEETTVPVVTKPTVTANKVKGNYVEVVCDSLNIRSTGSMSGAIIGTVTKGTRLVHKGRDQAGWFLIEHEGKTGYVSHKAEYTKYVFTANLKYGSKGEAVKELKQLLNANGAKLTTTNGNYLNSTRAAVKRFQQSKKLSVDGIAGPKTIAALGGYFD
jgi:uncharacterized protein YgiM (DUF1202 family)